MDTPVEDSENQWLSTSRTAARLGVTPRTVYRLVDNAKIRSYRVGRVLRFKASDIDQLLELSVVAPGSLSHLYEPGAA